MKSNIELLLTNFLPDKRNYRVKYYSKSHLIRDPKIKEHMWIVVDKSTHEEHLSQPLQTNNKQFKIAVTFLTGYNGIFNVTSENITFCFLK